MKSSVPSGKIPDDVARVVEAIARFGAEWIRHETLGGQGVEAVIALGKPAEATWSSPATPSGASLPWRSST